jgi:ATP synthase E subunit
VTLAPLRDALLAEAAAEARRLEEEARERAAATVAAAEERASAATVRRLAEAHALAQARAQRAAAAARRRARAGVLAAQRAVFDDLVRRAREDLVARAGGVEFAALLDRLADDARARLGGPGPPGAPGAATVDVAPAPDGGLVGRAGSRWVDYSLAAQLERAVDAVVAEEGESLWA